MVNIYKLKLTVLQQEILRFLMVQSGASFNARALAQRLSVSQPAISKALPGLVRQEYITVRKDKESKRLAIELNRDNPLIAGLKRAENLKMVYESGLVAFLTDTFPGATIILFGSYAFGEDTTTSDVDIAVIGAKEKEAVLEAFGAALGRPVVLQYFPSLREVQKSLRNNILNGIVLKGVVDL